jgi:thermitase
MKNVILALAILAVPGLAHAERFIVKNPKGPIMGHTVETMTIGSNTYVVVEAPKFANLLASFANGAEKVSEEALIKIPAETARAVDGEKAWHVDALKYSALPQLRDGRDIIVADLDTGADYKHPALKDHLWTNPKGCAAPQNPTGDCHGYDFDKKTADPMDGDQHGTHTAGLMVASADPASNAQGVAPAAQLMIVRIIGDEQTGFLANAALGVKYAVDNGAKVLSNSWRVYKSWTTFDPNDANVALLHDAIKYAGDHGAIFVAAAGNESIDMNTGMATDPMFPGGFNDLPNLVVVAASDSTGAMASFSNYGTNFVDVAAPGDNIISTIPGGGWMSMSGTSMATPIVSGSIARALSAKMTMQDAIARLKTTSVAADAWKDKVKAGGIIDLSSYLAQ